MTCPEPPDPPSRPIHDPADEIDVALDDADTPDLPEPGPTVPDDAEYLGSYATIAAYLRAMLEPEVPLIGAHLIRRAANRAPAAYTPKHHPSPRSTCSH